MTGTHETHKWQGFNGMMGTPKSLRIENGWEITNHPFETGSLGFQEVHRSRNQEVSNGWKMVKTKYFPSKDV